MAGASYDDLLELARGVAQEAAAMVRARRAQGVEVADTKSSPTDVVTEADRAAEELIRARLLAARPDDGFLGEEGASRESASGVTWVVDPIDGTVNYLYGIPQFSVSIAASVDGEPVAGVVVNGTSGECFTAVRDGGAACDGRPIRVRRPAPASEQLVLTGFSYERDVRVRQAAAVAALLGHVRDVRRFGSAALDLCFIGAGRADAYVEEGLNPWDVAAGGLVAREAGAELRTVPGPGSKAVVVCAPEAGFEDFHALVRSCGFLDASVETDPSSGRG